MPVPASINDLSTTAGSNSPPGSEPPATIDDYLRAHASFMAQLRNVSGLGSTAGQFLAFSAANTAALKDIVGTVSESGGTPTGAIIESGTNSNGKYTKYADGTLICWREGFGGLSTTTATGSIYRSSSDVTWTFPASFVEFPAVSASAGVLRWCACGSTGLTTATIRQYGPVSSATLIDMSAQAIGRWF